MSLESMLNRAKDLLAKAKKQAEMNLSMFGHDDADKVAYAQGVVDGIDSAMKEIVFEPFETRMGVRIVYIGRRELTDVDRFGIIDEGYKSGIQSIRNSGSNQGRNRARARQCGVNLSIACRQVGLRNRNRGRRRG